MKIVVTGATGNVGTSVLGSLGLDNSVTEIVGVARRKPNLQLPKVRWEQADVSNDRLDPILEGADAVIHLAWVVQPSHQPHVLQRINVDGSKRVFEAVARLGIPKLVVASSIGAYSPGPDANPVDEHWPTNGISTSSYSMQKVAIERALDDFEKTNPNIAVVRMRPSLIFKGDAASEIHRFFLGPFVPPQLFRFRKVPVLPIPGDLRFQAMHSSDAADAYRLAVLKDVRGAFNIASTPILKPSDVAEIFNAKTVDLPKPILRAAVDVSWKLRLQRTDVGWIDMATKGPTIDSSRAQEELGWKPEVSSNDALRELIDGIAQSRSWATTPLRKEKSGL